MYGNDNLILLTDSYKVSHYRQYPPGTEHVYSYFESRGGQFEETVFFGLHYYLQQYLSLRVSQWDVLEAAELYAQHFGDPALFNKAGWEYIVDHHEGRLPLRIKAVPEGTVVPTHQVLMTVENTDPKVPWLTNWVETLLVQSWYPITVATKSRAMKRLIAGYLRETGDERLLDFKLHDFGFRGVSSVESAALGGCAHLVNFKGTDTVSALMLARLVYGEPMAGFSIPAAEHSTITSWGQDREVDAYRNMIQQFGGGPLYAVVSDSYDIIRACNDLWGGQLLQEVQDAPGTLVVRPDSGTPHVVVPQVIDLLLRKFGGQENAKGYHVLNPKVRVIQGDGIDLDETEAILQAMRTHGQSADNIAFGMGGALLQKLDRDTNKFAFKCSWVSGAEEVMKHGQPGIRPWAREVYKDPITDSGKRSKRGRLKLVYSKDGFFNAQVNETNGWATVADTAYPHHRDQLQTVFLDGQIREFPSLAQIRERAQLPELQEIGR